MSEEEYYASLLANPDYAKPKFSIYRFKNILNGKVYIGQTIVPVRKRLIQHMTFSRPWTKCQKTYFHNALNKNGLINFKFDVIEICASQEELDIREKYWISYYKSNNKQYGYNIECGGKDGRKGTKLTEEHKDKLLKANLGKHRSDDTKLNLSKVHRQLWENEEFRNTHLSIVRNNLSASWEKTQKKIYQYDTNGDFVAIWNKCKDAADFLYGTGKGGSLTRNIKLNNKRGKLGFSKKGYIWSFFAPQRKEGI